ncbi:MAG: type 1 glutamine amidotransferase domain-containing protein [Azospirillaceae bacterium]
MPDHDPRVLIVTTSNGVMGDTGKPTGFHWEELATPYHAFTDAGFGVVIASIRGGRPPYDPGSLAEHPAERPASVRRFLDDQAALRLLDETRPIAEVPAGDFDAIYLPGGHGTMWDLPGNPALAAALSATAERDGVVSAVCHGPAGFVGVRRSDGRPLVEGRRINAFTDAEERKVGLDGTVPFLLETKLREAGAVFEGAEPFAAKVVEDGPLITGQNPASAQPLAEAVIAAVRARRARQAAE